MNLPCTFDDVGILWVPLEDIPARDRSDASVRPTDRISAGAEVVEIESRGGWLCVLTPDGRDARTRLEDRWA